MRVPISKSVLNAVQRSDLWSQQNYAGGGVGTPPATYKWWLIAQVEAGLSSSSSSGIAQPMDNQARCNQRQGGCRWGFEGVPASSPLPRGPNLRQSTWLGATRNVLNGRSFNPSALPVMLGAFPSDRHAEVSFGWYARCVLSLSRKHIALITSWLHYCTMLGLGGKARSCL